jgi:hypothetical protein
MFNLLTYINQPTYVIGLIITYLLRHTVNILLAKKWTISISLINILKLKKIGRP